MTAVILVFSSYSVLKLLFRTQYVIRLSSRTVSQLSICWFVCASEISTISNSHFLSHSLGALSVTLFFSS